MKKKDEGSLFESQEMSFETALEKLEENVKKLEDGKIPLQDAMELFKESIQLSDVCLKELDDAEQVLTKITLTSKGLKEEEWDPTGGEE